MNKDLVKLAAIGLAAGLCFSGSSASTERGEIAMSCSKSKSEMPAMDQEDSYKGNGDKSSCSGKSGCSSTSSSEVQESEKMDKSEEAMSESSEKRLSAAQKVMQEESLPEIE
ncbi:MAG TPA: hypothetical protein VLE89_08425 [Chlamydiales bacterium]|nr:hypothetical protein [Chlamydiales bacterium]